MVDVPIGLLAGTAYGSAPYAGMPMPVRQPPTIQVLLANTKLFAPLIPHGARYVPITYPVPIPPSIFFGWGTGSSSLVTLMQTSEGLVTVAFSGHSVVTPATGGVGHL